MNEYPPVVIERTFDATIDRVYQAWTDPEQLVQWFKGSPETKVLKAEADPRPGGTYRITIGTPGEPWVLFGTYLQATEPNLIEFTWLWEEATMEPRETIVKVELEAQGDQTKLTLTHSNFSNDQSFQAHGAGWNGVLKTLASFLGG